MPIQLPLEARLWGQDGDQWPDRRVSLSSENHAVMISPRMAEMGTARKEAQFLADSVNEYAEALPLIHQMKEKLQELLSKNGAEDPDIADLIAQADKAIESTSFDRLNEFPIL